MNDHDSLRRSLAALLTALAVAALLAGCRAKESEGKAAASRPAVEQIDADDYRNEITTIDRLVFSEYIDDRYRMMLVGNLAALAGRLDVPARSIPLRQRIAKLRELATRVQDDAAPMLPQELQQGWIATRNDLFGTREWYANSTSDAMRWPGESLGRGQIPSDVNAAQPGQAAHSYVLAPPRFELPGRWAVAESVVNGAPAPDSPETGALWSFDAEGLTIDRGSLAGRYSYIDYIDSRGPALRVEAQGGSLTGWILYQFTANGKLVVAFSGDLNQRPEGFTAPKVEVITGAANAPAPQPDGGTAPPAAAAPQEPPAAVAAPAPAAVVPAGPAHFMLTLDPVQ